MYIDFDPSSEESSLGKYLKSVREEKEISIEELAETTKIKQDYLEAIESDKYDLLPEGPYLTLFLKSYSEALELDYDKVVGYLEVATAQQSAKTSKSKSAAPSPAQAPAVPAPPKETAPPDPKPQTLKPVVDSLDKTKHQKTAPSQSTETRKYLAIIGAFVFLAFIAVIILIISTQKSSENQEPEAVHNESAEPEPVIIDSVAIKLDQFLKSFDSLTVSIYPASQQAVTILADNKPQTKLVYPQAIWTVSAFDSLMIRMERNDGSEIFLNGYLLKNDSIGMTGDHGLTFNKINWIEFVDTTERQ